MATQQQYGKVDWAGEDRQNNSQYSRGDKFMTLEPGLNRIRILSEAYKYVFHKIKFQNDSQSKFGRNIRCSIKECPLCAQGEPQKIKYVFGVVNRKTKEFKYLDAAQAIHIAIKGIQKNMPGYENVYDYDLNIIVNPNGGSTNYYQTLQGEKSPMSADDIEMMDNVDVEFIEKFIEPVSPEDVSKSVDRIQSWLEKQAAKMAAEAAPAGQGQERQSAPQKPQAGRPRKAVQAAPSPPPQEDNDEPEQKTIDDSAFNFKLIKK